ncbi:PKD domain-containing protein [Methanospirillum stamsii]|uniref:PKD domain-containing protein n=1 Tax=Methanospirillum stamsii TaxID=1277351 RepID=A0A2V2NAK0_9EURY|nr:PKD domain-containing protein [Methanospirillum stamsii]PWR73508.1 hypothetical protein DLD82_09700 [Methanospirillum stamsii]
MKIITDLYDAGINLYKEGEYEKAAEKFVKLLDFDKTNPKAWNALGICLSKMEDYQKARTCFINAMKFDPDNPVYLKNLKKTTEKIRPTKPEEPKTSILKQIRRTLSEFNIGTTEYTCLLIGFILLGIYFLTPLAGIIVPSPTHEIIGICGIIFIFFFLITALMKYLQFLGVKRIHFIITLIAILIVAFPIFHLLNLSGSKELIPANLSEFHERTYEPLITPDEPSNIDPYAIMASADTGKNETLAPEPVLNKHCTKPTPLFEYQIVSIDPYMVQFIDKTDTLLSPSSVNWDFGDNTISAEKTPVHEYPRLGSYAVNLTVRNDCGDTDSLVRTIHPVYANLTPNILINPVQGNVPLTISCTDLSSPFSEISSWRWTFGDGAVYETGSPENRNSTHTYQKSGTYYVTLTVENRYHQQFITTGQVTAKSYGIISGYLWSDDNRNGIREDTEQNLTGWHVILEKKQDNGWVPVETRSTDTLGTYHFTITDTGGTYRVRVFYPPSKIFEITNPDNTILPNVSGSLRLYNPEDMHQQNFGILETYPDQYHEVSLITSRTGHINAGGKIRWQQDGDDGSIIVNGTTYSMKDGSIDEISYFAPSNSSHISIAGDLHAQNLSNVSFMMDKTLIDSGECSYLESSSESGYHTTLTLTLNPERESDVSLIWDGKEIPVSWREKITIIGLTPMENQKMELELRPDQVFFIGRAESYEIT